MKSGGINPYRKEKMVMNSTLNNSSMMEDYQKTSGSNRFANTNILKECFNYAALNENKSPNAPARYKRKNNDTVSKDDRTILHSTEL